ncbi:MAG: type II toxin-antitoxin system VapC family toxin [Acidimicrobiales bacterium]
MSDPAAWVLDASALLAFLFEEPGGETVGKGLASSVISAVNLSEVIAKSAERGAEVDHVRNDLADVGIEVAVFDADAAEATAALRPDTRSAGLSLADRACLALARRLQLPAVTADKAWRNTSIAAGIAVIVIR